MRETNKRTLRGSLLLLLAALIWGVAFVAQRVGMDYVGPFTFNAVRNLMGAAVLVPCIYFLGRVRAKDDDQERRAAEEIITAEKAAVESAASGSAAGKLAASGTGAARQRRTLLIGGAVCGFLLCVASNLQQLGIKYTTVGKAGFITAMYIVMVPLLGIFLGRRIGKRIWLSVLLAVVGLYLLSMTESLSISKGDFYTLLCALAFAFQIMAVDYFGARTDGVKLACLEFLVCGLLTLIPMALTEEMSLSGLWAARIPLLYAGVLSCGVAYTLQILGQRDLSPALAALIMSLESVISALAGWAILGQTLTVRELLGCALMFAAILLAQLPKRKREAR